MQSRRLPATLPNVVRYLVLLKVSGRANYIDAIERYFVRIESPSAIEEKLGIPKTVVKGVTQYVRELFRSTGAPPSDERIKQVLEMVLPRIGAVNEAFSWCDASYVRCRICGARVRFTDFEDHIRRCHSNVVDEIASEIVRDIVSEAMRK